MRKKLVKVGLFALLILLAASCRNYVFVPVPGFDGGGISLSNVERYQATYPEVDWDAVVEMAVNQAGQGVRNGMESKLRDVGSSTIGLLAANALTDTQIATTSVTSLILDIVFHDYMDNASGVVISNGTMSFTLSATRTTTINDATTTNRYDIVSYTAETSVPLAMISAEISAMVSVSNVGTDAGIHMTVSVNAGITEGVEITGAVATNVSLNVAESTGSATVGGEELTGSDVEPENPVPVYPIGSEQKPFQIVDDTGMKELQTMLDSASEPVYAEMLSDVVISLPEGENVVAFFSVGEGKALNLNMQGHSIMADGNYSNQRYYLIAVYGKLILNGNNGQLGGHWKTNSTSRGIAVYSGATADINDLVLVTFSQTYGSGIFVEGTAHINGVTINGTYYAIGTDGGESVISIDNSRMISIASNGLTYDGSNRDGYAYTVSSSGDITMGTSEVYGVQGGISIIGGTANLNTGIHSETTADILNYVEDEYIDDYTTFYSTFCHKASKVPEVGECHYAIYIAGEYNTADNPKCIVNGGEYVSADKYAVLVGNSADGGAGATAYASIIGGTFWSNNEKYAAVNADTNPQYGHGVLSIEGGSFRTNTNLSLYIDPERFEISDTADADGFYIVSAIN